MDGLLEKGAKINKELLETYEQWDKEHPFDVGEGWGMEPWCQEEMPLEEDFVQSIAKSTDTALVIIGRTAEKNRTTMKMKVHIS